MEQIVYKNIRIQLLSEDVVRIERAGKDGFCDENTFFIPSRLQYEKARIEYSREENVICFSEYKLYLPEEGKSLAGVKLEKNGKRVYTYRKQPNSGELPPLDKTSEVFAVFDCPRILVPEGGYSADRKGEYIVEENAQDVYLLLCGKDFKKLRRLYVELTGRCEFVRLSTFGGWESKYYAYSEEEAKQLILDYEKHNMRLRAGLGVQCEPKALPEHETIFGLCARARRGSNVQRPSRACRGHEERVRRKGDRLPREESAIPYGAWAGHLVV